LLLFKIRLFLIKKTTKKIIKKTTKKIMQDQTQQINFNNYPLVDPYSNYMMVFSRSLKMRHGYQLITSKYHMSYSLLCIDYDKFSKNLNILGVTDELLIYRILSDEKFSSISEEEKSLQVYHSPDLLNLQFVIQTLSLSDLLEMSFFHQYILKCSEIELSRNIIFVIEDIRYLDFLATLKSHQIVTGVMSVRF
jgi:hypothetical protein